MPAVSGGHCNASASFCDGAIHPSVCLGLELSESVVAVPVCNFCHRHLVRCEQAGLKERAFLSSAVDTLSGMRGIRG